jgi:ParB family transcriptional regulator, chromosome partitioning protein
MLGKGLESLIPQKGSQGSGAPGTGGLSAGAGAPPMIIAHQSAPQDLPAGDGVVRERELPTPPREQELPVPETAEELDLPPPAGNISEPPSVVAVTSPVPQTATEPLPRDPKNIIEPKQKRKEPVPQDYVFHIEVEKIAANPSQPRRAFNEDAIREMANSIREFGILQPLVVSKIEKETPMGIDVAYQLIAGERRLRAAKLLGLRVVPVIIRNVDLEREKLELAVIENLQREDLNPVEMARAFQRLQEEFRMTQREIAAKLGKSRETVANTVRLLDLPEYIQDALQKGMLSESHARLMIAVENPAAQRQLYDDIVEHGLTTRDVKERVKRFGAAGIHHRGRPSLAEMESHLPPEVRAAQDELSATLGAPVQIQQGATAGKIMISFYSPEELENILRKLGKEED